MPAPFSAQFPANPDFPDLLQSTPTRNDWFQTRRPELARLIQLCEYGFLPPAPPKVEARLLYENPAAYSGKARLRELELSWGVPGFSLNLLLVTPRGDEPAPVFSGPSFSGNHTHVPDEGVQITGPVPDDVPNAGRNSRASVWDIEASVERGYAVAVFHAGAFVQDHAETAFPRLEAFRAAHHAQAEPGAQCATLGAWAWALQRVMDYLVTDPKIDATRVAAAGHSRLGKTALLAAALDPRFAMVIPSQACCGGTAPARHGGRPGVETIASINNAFPHWFCGNFKSFSDCPERLPYDHHALLALCAPHPVMLSNASGDLWADPAGQFSVAQAADPVYKLLGATGLEVDQMPAVDEFTLGRLGFFLRPGRHAMTPAEWTVWRQFAKRWL